MTAFNTA